MLFGDRKTLSSTDVAAKECPVYKDRSSRFRPLTFCQVERLWVFRVYSGSVQRLPLHISTSKLFLLRVKVFCGCTETPNECLTCMYVGCLSEEGTSVAAARRLSTLQRRCNAKERAGINPASCAVSPSTQRWELSSVSAECRGFWQANLCVATSAPYMDVLETCDKVFLLWMGEAHTLTLQHSVYLWHTVVFFYNAASHLQWCRLGLHIFWHNWDYSSSSIKRRKMIGMKMASSKNPVHIRYLILDSSTKFWGKCYETKRQNIR